jgi:hypothetical protein
VGRGNVVINLYNAFPKEVGVYFETDSQSIQFIVKEDRFVGASILFVEIY